MTGSAPVIQPVVEAEDKTLKAEMAAKQRQLEQEQAVRSVFILS
jgi:hypothetical protein